ncbi:MAG: hypothetical protein ACREQ3_13865, partial [Candidatus Binatia bacterium]
VTSDERQVTSEAKHQGCMLLEALRKLLDKGLLLRCSPFDKLRANGAGVEILKDYPFVLSLSKHDFPLSVVHLTVSGEPLISSSSRGESGA